jgi:hypothetical protein
MVRSFIGLKGHSSTIQEALSMQGCRRATPAGVRPSLKAYYTQETPDCQPNNPSAMKTCLFSLCLLFCLSTTNAFANPLPEDPQEPLIVRSYLATGGLEVTLANLEKTRTTLKLEDLDRDKVVYSHMVRNRNGYSYNLNLDKLPEGRYLLSVTKNNTVRQQVLVIAAHGLMCSDWK